MKIILMRRMSLQKLMIQGENKRKMLNFDQLSKESLMLLAVFTDYLLESDTSVYEFFNGTIYNQIVRTKNKQNTVEIISSSDFFKRINEEKEIIKLINSKNFSNQEEIEEISEEWMENISEFLWLDSNYKHLLLIKKVIKTLEELSHNEVLRIRAGVGSNENTIPEEE